MNLITGLKKWNFISVLIVCPMYFSQISSSLSHSRVNLCLSYVYHTSIFLYILPWDSPKQYIIYFCSVWNQKISIFCRLFIKHYVYNVCPCRHIHWNFTSAVYSILLYEYTTIYLSIILPMYMWVPQEPSPMFC